VIIVTNDTILLTVSVLMSGIPAEDLDLKEPRAHMKRSKSLPVWLMTMDCLVATVLTQQSQLRLVS